MKFNSTPGQPARLTVTQNDKRRAKLNRRELTIEIAGLTRAIRQLELDGIGGRAIVALRRQLLEAKLTLQTNYGVAK